MKNGRHDPEVGIQGPIRSNFHGNAGIQQPKCNDQRGLAEVWNRRTRERGSGLDSARSAIQDPELDPANLILSRSVGVFDAELASLQSMFEPHRRYGTDHCS